ncbi:MAG TPA: homoserine kinase [Roseiarcus sp.]|nr:homoserine kinase [Roseiarcus sp.]
MAVYTEVSDEALAAFLDGYDLGAVQSFKGIAEGVENSNFLLVCEDGRFFLTLFEKRVKKDDLPFFIGLMEHLAQRGVTCPQPVRSREGEALGSLADRPAVIVTFLNGLSIRRPSARHCASVGEALATIHRDGDRFALRRPNALSIGGWPSLLATAEARADEVAPGLAREAAQTLAALQSAWPKALPEGVIHADLFPDNVLFLGEDLSGLIDFYFACNDALAYDLAVCLNAWCFEPNVSFNITKGMALINGYEKIRKLSDAEVEALPILARGAALRFMLTRLVDWLNVPPGAKVVPKDPLEYLKKMRFHAAIRNAREYGLTR